MKLHRLVLKNYRGIDYREIEFPDHGVVVGGRRSARSRFADHVGKQKRASGWRHTASGQRHKRCTDAGLEVADPRTTWLNTARSRLCCGAPFFVLKAS